MTLRIPRGSTVALPLGQPWNRELEAGFLPASVHLGWRPESLEVDAWMADSDVFTEATADNQRMWQLGDVFEAFLQVEGRSDYTELHVVPGNLRCHLQLSGVEARLAPDFSQRDFEALLVLPAAFTSHANLSLEGWNVSLSVPPAVLGLPAFAEGQNLRVSFCRYDAGPNRPAIVSTTSHHSVLDFHRPQEWTRCLLI